MFNVLEKRSDLKRIKDIVIQRIMIRCITILILNIGTSYYSFDREPISNLFEYTVFIYSSIT